MRPSVAVTLLVLALLAAPATAQDHEHLTSTGVVVAHDLAPDGLTYVGNLNHFVVLYLGDDDEPDFHQQNGVRVTLDGDVVFATTEDSGHDYDGVYGFDVVFGRPGAFAVEALQDGEVKARFGGNVTQGPAAVGAPGLAVTPTSGTLPANPPQPSPFTFTYAAQDNGTAFAHSDAVLEVFRDPSTATAGETRDVASGGLVLRVKTHTHDADEVQRVEAAFPVGGYTARAATYLSYPNADDAFFQPAAAISELVSWGGDPPAAPPTPFAPAPLGDNLVRRGTGGEGLLLLGTYDPYDVVGPGTLQHLAAIVLDPATGAPRQHVDFEARLVGPLGTVLASDTLHEYDGVLEVDAMQETPGQYVLRVDAKAGDWTGHVDLPYQVAGGAGTIGAGPQVVHLDAPDALRAGEAARFTFRIADPSGAAAFQHGEVDVVIDRVDGPDEAWGVPVLRAKLHTHASGEFAFDFAPPEAGRYVVRATPYPLGATPTPTYWGDGVGGGLTWGLDVGPGASVGTDPLGAGDEGGPQDAPGVAPATLLVALAALAVRRRR